MKAIEANIYHSRFGDCSNDGISARCKSILLPCADGPIDIDDGDLPPNLCEVIRQKILGREYVHIQPYGTHASGRCSMHGGAIVDSSDSRFGEIVNNGGYPVHLHDRFE